MTSCWSTSSEVASEIVSIWSGLVVVRKAEIAFDLHWGAPSFRPPSFVQAQTLDGRPYVAKDTEPYTQFWLSERERLLLALFARRGVPKRIVVGHDYRSYSAAIKAALTTGLLAGGAEVHDIGLALSPMAYFAQFDLGVEGVAIQYGKCCRPIPGDAIVGQFRKGQGLIVHLRDCVTLRKQRVESVPH